jgi:hypothetical protein
MNYIVNLITFFRTPSPTNICPLCYVAEAVCVDIKLTTQKLSSFLKITDTDMK